MATILPSRFVLKNGKEVIFRSPTADDAESFLKFREIIPHESTHTMQYVGMKLPTVEETANRLTLQQEDKTTVNICAFDEEKVIACLNFRLPHDDHPWVKHLGQFGMFILREYWGQGIGKRLLELQDDHARTINVSRIEAMVRVENERGINLYRHSGYKIEGRREKAAKIDGKFVDEFFIAKLLDLPKNEWRPPTLETQRLILRPIELSDAEAIFQYAKNPNVSRFTLWEPHQTIQDSLNYIKEYVFNYYAQGVPEPFGISLKENPQKLIGTVGCFWSSRHDKSMELAYAISEDYWGQGLVAEAAQTVIDYCFKEFSLKRIQARCKIENKASARVMEKIGMSYEGTLKSEIYHRNRHWDMAYYAKVIE